MLLVRLVTLFLGVAAWLQPDSHGAGAVTRKQPYHGWREALVLSNGKVEAIIVPEIGRVMQFRFAGQEEGPFWENRALDGKMPDSQSSEWGNFGGDKSWPAPQSDWAKMTGRGWPPPAAFDAMPVEVSVGNTVILKTPIDRHYGIQEERRISLSPGAAEMIIETIYHKKEGPPVRVSIWTITQLKHPQLVFMPLPAKSIFPEGFTSQSTALPLDLELRDGAVLCGRSLTENTKIGSDASRIFWCGETHIVEVHAERETGEFPDGGSSAEVYTNADPNAYVELELLGPLRTLHSGESMSRRQAYRLYPRNGADPEAQIRALLRK